jgi:hypothetical protein
VNKDGAAANLRMIAGAYSREQTTAAA